MSLTDEHNHPDDPGPPAESREAMIERDMATLAALYVPFHESQLRRRNQGGVELMYITMRMAQNRLDEVLTPRNWGSTYDSKPPVMECKVWIRLPSGMVIERIDGGGSADMQNADDDIKSAYSDSFKRACAALGVGRYLYGDGIPGWVYHYYPDAREEVERHMRRGGSGGGHGGGYQGQSYQGRDQGRAQGGPQGQQPPPRTYAPSRSSGVQPQGQQPQGNGNRPPDSPRALFAWAQKESDRTGSNVLSWLNEWAKAEGFDWFPDGVPARVIDWPVDAVRPAWEAMTGQAAPPPARAPQQSAPARRPDSPIQGGRPAAPRGDANEDDIPF